MRASLTVGDGGAEPGHAGHDADYQAMDMAMTESILAFPAATEGKGNQPLEPTVLADGTKQYEITAAITQWEVEPGKVVEAWTYNGMAPGPALRVDEGDRVSVVVHNQLPMGTDVHFHGVKVDNAMDGVAPLTQPLIEAGQTFTYEFVAEGPAVAMYHAHHHAQLQVPNGLFGTVVIGDLPLPTGRVIGGIEVPTTVDVTTELPMVLNDAGVIGYSLNGKSFPATEPLVVNQGDWFVVHYFNEGMQIHPMHLHGFPQLVYAKDGYPLDEPYWVDTLNVAPGERYSILVHATEAGAWVWHCHILNHVETEEGMFGMVTAVIVEP
jgi:FtsP/CotA-like multicopper oxidase with cupredoxin domain